MSISWETKAGQYNLQNNGNWELKGTNSSLEELLKIGGTLKIGATSIAIPTGSCFLDKLPRVHDALQKLELSQPSTGPTEAIKKFKGDLVKNLTSSAQEAILKVGENSKAVESGENSETTKALNLFKRIESEIEILNNDKKQQTTHASKHLQLGDEFAKEIFIATHPLPSKPNILEANQTRFKQWQDSGFIDEKGKIDFKKFDLSESEIRNAHLEGKIWIDETTGKFHMKVTGDCGDTAVKALKTLKEEANAAFEPTGPHSPISINPEDVGKLSPEDMAILQRGGQIQFKPLGNGRMLKLTLDPGENGEGAGLTIDAPGGKHKKIPLAVVFGGEALNGVRALIDGHPILENWRKEDFFGKAAIQQEINHPIPFTSFFDTITKSNEDDVSRKEAENTLWAAVYKYLALTMETEPATNSASETKSQATEAEEKQTDGPASKPLQPEYTEMQHDGEPIPSSRVEAHKWEPSTADKFGSAVKESIEVLEGRAKEEGTVLPPKEETNVFDALKNANFQFGNPNTPSSVSQAIPAEDENPEINKAQSVEAEDSPVVSAKRVGPQATFNKFNPSPLLLEAAKGVDDAIQDMLEKLKNVPKPINMDVSPELFNNPQFLVQAQKNNPELFEAIRARQIQDRLFELKKGLETPEDYESDRLLNLAKDVSDALSQLTQTASPSEPANASIPMREQTDASIHKISLQQAAQNFTQAVQGLIEATSENSQPNKRVVGSTQRHLRTRLPGSGLVSTR